MRRFDSFVRCLRAFYGCRVPAVLAAAVAVCSSLAASQSQAYFNNAQWSATATDGSLSGTGAPITLTWGIANDGTTVPNVLPGVNRSSDLIASLDGWFGNGGGGPLTARPWFGFLESAFDAWGAVSGLTFIYEPNDDGAIHGNSPGLLGIRADIRLAGGRYDGTVGTNFGTLAYSIAPDTADIFFDTDDVSYYSNPVDDAFSLRHTLMHEIGHSLGLGHVTSNAADILLEPFFQTGFDGPQIDDIRGVQWLYGDPLEADGGNDSIATATPLGELSLGSQVVIGADGDETSVDLSMNDFVSIHRSSDVDIYELTVDEPTRVEVNLTPVGGSYDQRIGGGASTTVQATRVGNLALEAQSAVAMLAESNLGGFGSNESLSFVATPGESYTVAVSGLVGATQLYRLDVATLALQTEGDYNGDGAADIADYTVWRDALLSSQTLAADGNGDGVINVQDYEVWRATFGVSASTLVRVPEPSALLMAAAIFPIFLPRRCRDSTGWL